MTYRVAVYDMDGVITRGDTFGRFLRARFHERPVRLAVLSCRNLLKLLASPVNRRVTELVIQAVVPAAMTGLAELDYTRKAAGLAKGLAREAGWLQEDVVAEIRRRHAEGAVIVVATACERRLAQEFLKAAEVPHDVLSASLLTPGLAAGAWIVEDYRIGERKASALAEMGVRLGEADFTTDSWVDLPTALACARTSVVCASDSDLPDRFVSQGVKVTRFRE